MVYGRFFMRCDNQWTNSPIAEEVKDARQLRRSLIYGAFSPPMILGRLVLVVRLRLYNVSAGKYVIVAGGE